MRLTRTAPRLSYSTVLRAWIKERVAREKGIVVIFLESLCDDPAVIAANVALKVSSGDPDYKDMPPEKAKADFLRRIEEYEKVYQTITEPEDLSYLRIINVGRQADVVRIHGYLQSRIAFYLMNLHLKPRAIFFSRVRHRLILRQPVRSRRSLAWRESIQRRGQNRWRCALVRTRSTVLSNTPSANQR